MTEIDLCAWDDHGRSCPCRGVMNTTGKWYCREHWHRLNNLPADGVGNYAVLPAVRSLHMRMWDEWKYNSATKRLERIKTEPEPMPEPVTEDSW